MLCKIAELFTEIPAAGGLAPRCVEYLCNEAIGADIVIRTELYHPEYWPGCSDEMIAYMESGSIFYSNLLRFDGMMLHASAVEMGGRAYIFSGPCGTGKSTHTRIWQQLFGEKAQVFNDDKPALRRIDGKWYAYGTPWCGKDGINQNKKVPLAGICFLKQAKENKVRKISANEAMQNIFSQTFYKFRKAEKLSMLLSVVDKLVREIPIFELENRPEPAAARLSYETMRTAAEEMGL